MSCILTGEVGVPELSGLFCGCLMLYSDIRAAYAGENKPWLTLAAAYIRCERNHLYEYGLY